MSHSSGGSSIGTGTEADINENHPDGFPSKTFGTETMFTPAAASEIPADQESVRAAAGAKPGSPSQRVENADLTEADVAQADELLHDVPADGVPANPDDFPDGPNVGPSPWEEDAARGRG